MGIIGFAAYETQQGLTEAKIIGLGSILVIILLISWVFRSPIPVMLMSLVIAIGVISALSVASLLFGRLHVLSILVGTSLIGIAVDYVFHYFAKNAFNSNKIVAAKILRPITLGLITSVLGYSALFLSALEVLKQIAFVSSIGLIAAYLSVLILLPRIDFDLSSKAHLSFKLFTKANRFFSLRSYKVFCATTSLIILTLGTILLPRINFNDKVELLHASPEHLKKQQLIIESMVKEAAPSKSLVVSATSKDSLLKKLEHIDVLLRKEVAKENIDSYIGLQQFLHSNQYQKKSKALLDAWLDSEQINELLSILGIPPESIKKIESSTVLNQKDFIGTPYDALIDKLLVIGDDGRFYGLVKLIGVNNLTTVSHFVDLDSSVFILDPKVQFSDFLSKVRVDSIYFVACAYLIILFFLIVVSGLKSALKQFIPPLAAALLGLYVAIALGQMINIFHVVALTLVLGIGIDYTIFYANSKGQDKPDMVLAISCSMISTVLAFGLMALSQTPAVAGFGTVVLVGIFSAYFLAPFAKELN